MSQHYTLSCAIRLIVWNWNLITIGVRTWQMLGSAWKCTVLSNTFWAPKIGFSQFLLCEATWAIVEISTKTSLLWESQVLCAAQDLPGTNTIGYEVSIPHNQLNSAWKCIMLRNKFWAPKISFLNFLLCEATWATVKISTKTSLLWERQVLCAAQDLPGTNTIGYEVSIPHNQLNSAWKCI